MTRTAVAAAIAAGLLPQALLFGAARGDEIRRPTIPAVLLGTWAEKTEQCATDDKSNVVIEATKYGDGSGSCAVRWVVQTAGSRGVNYAIHALCTSAANPNKTQLVNIVIRPQDAGTAEMGRSFGDLKTYRRCP